MDGERTENLINLVFEYPCLWNKQEKSYSRRNCKINAWDEIGRQLGTDAKEAKDLWRSLRDKYVREKKKAEDSERSGRSRQ